MGLQLSLLDPQNEPALALTNKICEFDPKGFTNIERQEKITIFGIFFKSGNTIKACKSGFSYCFLTDFTEFFFRVSMLLNFGFLTNEASWIHQILNLMSR